MLDATALKVIADAIKAVSSLIETKFFQIGKRLESSIEILTRLTTSLERLRSELKGDDLRQAMLALSQVAPRVSEIGRARSGDRATLDRLQVLMSGISARLGHMNEAVKDADALAVNAKIASAVISAAGTDFEGFAKQIGRTLQLTRQSLENFGEELRGARDRVGAASSRQGSLERRQEEAAHSVTARIGGAVESMAAHNDRAAETVTLVGQRGDLIRQRIGSAIVALQIGDATHQRLEHAGRGLDLLLQALARIAGDAPHTDQRDGLIHSLCPVLSALLSDAAAEFEGDMRQVATALDSLAEDARALRQLGVTTYGSSEGGHRAFISELEAQVRQASALFESFGRTHAETNRVIGSVSDATGSLSRHLATVRSLEADIRIMGLNATLKCARVGREGRALGVIAQELRSYANLFATEAEALMGEVDSIAAASGSLSHRDGGGADAIATITQTMAASLSRLRTVGEVLERTLGELDEDSGRVAQLLEETVASVRGRDEIGAALARAVEGFADVARGFEGGSSELPAAAEQIVAALEHSYTMASERLVHRRFFGATRPSTALESGPEAAALDDVLF